LFFNACVSIFGFNRTLKEMGNARPSFVYNALATSNRDDQDFEDVVKSAAASMSTAAVDPTVSTLGSFILAMLANPEAQRTAQSEIDTVVGPDRLP